MVLPVIFVFDGTNFTSYVNEDRAYGFIGCKTKLADRSKRIEFRNIEERFSIHIFVRIKTAPAKQSVLNAAG